MEKIIRSIEKLSEEIKNYKIIGIISLGKNMYDILNEKIKNNKLKVPKNILLFSSVPQIDVLERASLFITHSGMNSVSETIHYGVPVICMPQGLLTDQPLVSRRIADELSLGIRLDTFSFTPEELVKSMKTILFDKSYLERAIRLSMLSRRYNGSVNGANELINLIDRKNK
jgi:UDP:flavonoid glycosyltransferase YjiC (YdhE family)